LNDSTNTAWLPDLLYTERGFVSGVALVTEASGAIASLVPEPELECPVIPLPGRALLPGLVNAHSHAFQRVLRGLTEYRADATGDSFWTWRDLMYAVAARLSPDDLYAASRMAFLEMALSGITAVGEFHYLHHALDGACYEDPNQLARIVTQAANDVGLRIALLRVAYARAGFQTPPDPHQIRFLETDPDVFLERLDQLRTTLAVAGGMAWVGAAPHSVRAVPLAYLKEVFSFANEQHLPIHMHVAEQPAEIADCTTEYGRSPISLLHSEGLLSDRFTAVHLIHVNREDVRLLVDGGAAVCACPTTERNLGDGPLPAELFFREGLSVCLGSDSHIQIDLLEDARELEYLARLDTRKRVVLVPDGEVGPAALASKLFAAATANGARSIDANSGALQPGLAADFFTVDLSDPSIAGASPESLLVNIVFSLARSAIRDVVVSGRRIVTDGHHNAQEEICQAFALLQRRLWAT
jgi:formimidoylglutamate deiminase